MAPKSIFMRKKPHCNVCVIGGRGAGKTTLMVAMSRVCQDLTGSRAVNYIELDSAREEKEQRKTIHCSTIEMETGERHYAVTDCPGDMKYVSNTIRALALADAAVLVMDVTRGLSMDGMEDIILAAAMGVPQIIVYLNRCDELDEDLVELIDMDIREALDECGYDGDDVPIIHGNVIDALNDAGPCSDSGRELMYELDYMEQEIRECDKPLKMPIDKVIPMANGDVVVTGIVQRGVLRPNQDINIIGYSKNRFLARAVSAEIFHQTVFDEQYQAGMVEAGDMVGIRLRNFPAEYLKRGQILCENGAERVHQTVVLAVKLLKRDQGGMHTPIFSGFHPVFYAGLAEVSGTAYLPDGKDMAFPGETVRLAVDFDKPIPIVEGQSIVIRDGRTVAIGYVEQAY